MAGSAARLARARKAAINYMAYDTEEAGQPAAADSRRGAATSAGVEKPKAAKKKAAAPAQRVSFVDCVMKEKYKNRSM